MKISQALPVTRPAPSLSIYADLDSLLAASKQVSSLSVTNADELGETEQFAIEAAIEEIGHPDIETIEDLLAFTVDGKIQLIETDEPTTGEEVTVVFAHIQGNGVHGAVLADDSSLVRARISEGALLVRSPA